MCESSNGLHKGQERAETDRAGAVVSAQPIAISITLHHGYGMLWNAIF